MRSSSRTGHSRRLVPALPMGHLNPTGDDGGSTGARIGASGNPRTEERIVAWVIDDG